MSAESKSVDIPVWFNGTQRWMTGLTKRTTCDDVIYALLVSSGLHETESTDTFAIFEKWREVERPLSARTKILKIWTFWGEEQPNIQLSMRSLDDYFLPGESSLYMHSRRRCKKSSRHKERHSTQCKHHNKPGYTESTRLRTLEQLVKLVVSQERKIQKLNDRIQETDTLIDKHESEIHLHRVQQNGTDYVQNSYLNSHSSETSSSSSNYSSSNNADSTSFTSLDVRDLKDVFRESNFQQLEEIARICDSMEHVERRILQEQAKIQELTAEADKLAETGSGVGAEFHGECNVQLEEVRVQMIRAVTAYVTNEYNERELDRKIHMCLSEIMAKTEHIDDIHRKISEADLRVRESEHGQDPSKQHSTSSNMLSPAQHEYDHASTQQHIRYELRQFSHLPAVDRQFPSRSVYTPDPCAKSHQLDNDIKTDSGRTANESSQLRNAVLQEKSLTVGQICEGSVVGQKYEASVVGQKYETSDVGRKCENKVGYGQEVSCMGFNREGRSSRRAYKGPHRSSFVRSRSAERSSDSSKCATSSSRHEGESFDRGNSVACSHSERYTTKAIIDQYGLEMGTELQRPDVRDSFRRKTNLPISDHSNGVPGASCTSQNQRKENSQLVDSDRERRYQQQRQPNERIRHEDIKSARVGIMNADSSNGTDEYRQRRSGAEICTEDHYTRDLTTSVRGVHTSVNTQELEKMSNHRPTTGYMFSDQEKRTPLREDLFTKDRSPFDQNTSCLPRTGPNGSNWDYRENLNSKGGNLSPSKWIVDLTKTKDINSSGNPYLYKSPIARSNIYVSTNATNVQSHEGTEVDSKTQPSSSSMSIVTISGKQANSPTSERTMANSQPERQRRIQQYKDDMYRHNIRENGQPSFDPFSKYQSNQPTTNRDSASPRQVASVIPDIYSAKPCHKDASLSPSNQFTHTIKDARNGTHLQNGVVNYTQNGYDIQQPVHPAAEKHKHFSSDTATVHRQSDNLAAKISSSHSVTPDVTPSFAPKTTLSLLNHTEAVVSNVYTEGSGDESRGALYHIVSSKMKKTNNDSVVYQDNTTNTGSDKSPSQYPVHIKQNTGLIKPEVCGNSSKINDQNNRENPVSNPSFGSHNGEYNNPSFGSHNGEYNNPSFGSHNGEYNNSSNFSQNFGHPYRIYSTHIKDNLPSSPRIYSKSKGGHSSEQATYTQTSVNNKICNEAISSPQLKHSKVSATNRIYNETMTSQGHLSRHSVHFPTSVNGNGDLLLPKFSFQNSVNGANGYHNGGYKVARTANEINAGLSSGQHFQPRSRGYNAENKPSTNGVHSGNRTKLEDANDSNSDTGLSSMHSDETPNIETLV